jgi:hypothetical protein
VQLNKVDLVDPKPTQRIFEPRTGRPATSLSSFGRKKDFAAVFGKPRVHHHFCVPI